MLSLVTVTLRIFSYGKRNSTHVSTLMIETVVAVLLLDGS